jgi:hypothetical protein
MNGRRWVPYALLAPGTAWLLLFFAIPMGYMFIVSLQEGTLGTGFQLTWNFGIYPEVIGEFWEAQAAAADQIPNSGMAVINDIGDLKDIHPTNKQDVGRRLALLARARVYGEALVCEGPTLRRVRIGRRPHVASSSSTATRISGGLRIGRSMSCIPVWCCSTFRRSSPPATSPSSSGSLDLARWWCFRCQQWPGPKARSPPPTHSRIRDAPRDC